MKITINGKEQITTAANIAELAAELRLPDKGVAIATGNKMVPKNEWASRALQEGDALVIIRASCGG